MKIRSAGLIKSLLCLGLFFWIITICTAQDKDFSSCSQSPTNFHKLNQINVFQKFTSRPSNNTDEWGPFTSVNGAYNDTSYLYAIEQPLFRVGLVTEQTSGLFCTDKATFRVKNYYPSVPIQNDQTDWVKDNDGGGNYSAFSFNTVIPGKMITIERYYQNDGCSTGGGACSGNSPNNLIQTYYLCPLQDASVSIGSLSTPSVMEINSPNGTGTITVNYVREPGYCGTIQYFQCQLQYFDPASLTWVPQGTYTPMTAAATAIQYNNIQVGRYRITGQCQEVNYDLTRAGGTVIHSTAISNEISVQYGCQTAGPELAGNFSLITTSCVDNNGQSRPCVSPADNAISEPIATDDGGNPLTGAEQTFRIEKGFTYDVEFLSNIENMGEFYKAYSDADYTHIKPITYVDDELSNIVYPVTGGNFWKVWFNGGGNTCLPALFPGTGNAVPAPIGSFTNEFFQYSANGNYNCSGSPTLVLPASFTTPDANGVYMVNSGNMKADVAHRYRISGISFPDKMATILHISNDPAVMPGVTACAGNTQSAGTCCPHSDRSLRLTVGVSDIVLNADDGSCPNCKCVVELPNALYEKNSDGTDNSGYVLPADQGLLPGESVSIIIAQIKSKRAVIVHAGLTLSDGAILSVNDPRVPSNASHLGYDDGDISATNQTALSNYVESITYDDYRNILGHSRSYFDTKGELTQTQVKLLNGNGPYGIVLASQAIQDQYGRNVIQTLPAPIRNGGQTVVPGTYDNTGDPTSTSVPDCEISRDIPAPSGTLGYIDPGQLQRGEMVPFAYENNFTGKTFSVSDYAATASIGSLPAVFGDATGNSKLGWYYSANNANSSTLVTKEPYTPTSGYPYTQALYNTDGTNEMFTVVPPGDAYRNTGALSNASSPVNGLFIRNLATSEILKMPGATDPDGCNYYNGLSANPQLLTLYLFLLDKYAPGTQPTGFAPADYLQKLYRKKLTDQAGNVSYIILNEKDMPLITATQIATNNFEYAFNFYDTKGRLVSSVSPNGVAAFYASYCPSNVCTGGTDNSADIDHTVYTYDFEGRLTSSKDNDRGTTNFLYRLDGRLRFSQSDYQKPLYKFSYTNYDRLGRVAESGEYTQPAATSGFAFSKAESDPSTISDVSTILENTDVSGSWTGSTSNTGGLPYSSCNARVITFYDGDEKYNGLYVFPSASGTRDETFLLGKVTASIKVGVASTWYGYDERARIVKLVQDISGLGPKKVDYTYNANGQVSEVWYQDGAADAFYHYYKYDYDGRLTQAFAGVTKPVHGYSYDLDSVTNESSLTPIGNYDYYLHGPLKSLATGPGGGQHIDYLYTIEGWLKSINYPAPNSDPGQNTNDLFSMAMEYYSGDYYKAVGTGSPITSLKLSTSESTYTGNFNGIPRVITWMNNAVDPGVTKAYQYTYDSKYQLTASTRVGPQYTGGSPQFPFNIVTLARDNFNETFSYDKNGNMTALTRSDENGTSLNNLSMTYAANTNQLTGAGAYAATYTYDAKGQTTGVSGGTFNNGKAHAFTYDPFGMVTNVQQNSTNSSDYSYDASGQRVYKKIYNAAGTAAANEEYFVRDAQGNLLATYAKAASATVPTLEEIPVYGASKLGVNYFATGADEGIAYELKDHLGNVRAVAGYYGSITPYGQDYYAYGGEMGHSSFTHSLAAIHNRSRYQGENSEKDEETSLNHFEARDYDPVTGRWLSVDPSKQFWSGYLGMRNNPIINKDNDGKWTWLITAGIGAVANVSLDFALGNLRYGEENFYSKLAISAGSGALSGFFFGFGSGFLGLNFGKSLVLGASSNFIVGALELGANYQYANEIGSLSKPAFTSGASIIGSLMAESIIFSKYHKFGKFIGKVSAKYAPGTLNKIEVFLKYPVDISFGKLADETYKNLEQKLSTPEENPKLKIGVKVDE